MNDETMDFAGTLREQRGKQQTNPQNELATHEPTPPRSVRASGAIFFQQVEELQRHRDRLAGELAEANARIEQFQIALNAKASELETARLHEREAIAERDTERAERIRLGAVIEQTATALHNAMPQPKAAEPEKSTG